MSLLEIMSIVRDAAVIALAGFVAYFFRAQVSSLNATIKLLETENKRLTGMAAPALAAEWERMNRFANEMAAARQQAERELENLRQDAVDSNGQANLLGLSVGLLEGSSAIVNVVKEFWSAGGILSGRVVDERQVLNSLFQKQEQLLVESQRALAGDRPELVNMRESTARLLRAVEGPGAA